MTNTTLETETAFASLGLEAWRIVRRLKDYTASPEKPEVVETSGESGLEGGIRPSLVRRTSGVGREAHDRLKAPQFSHPATKSPSADRRDLISALHCEQINTRAPTRR